MYLLIKIVSITILLIGIINFSALAADEESLAQQAEQTGNIREALNYYVSALQKTTEGSSKDQELREKIIKLVQKIQPSPAVPEEVLKYEGRAEAAVQHAKTPDDYLDAAKEYKKALLCAPWVASYYFNLGVVLEKAGKPEEAIRRLQLYLLASPDAQDAKDVKKKISGLEYQIEKMAQEKQKPKLPTPKDMEGTWYRYTYYQDKVYKSETHVTSSGDWLLFDEFDNGKRVSSEPYIKFRLNGYKLEEGSFEFAGNRNKGSPSTYECLEQLKALGGFRSRMIPVKGTVSEDWQKITFRYRDMGSTPECTIDYYDFEVVYER